MTAREARRTLYSVYTGAAEKEAEIMDRIIGVTELQRRLRSVLDEVTTKHVSYVLTRGSRPEATWSGVNRK